METSELLKRVRKIEIKTRGLTNNIFAGEYHSMFKGRGMAFSEVREYQYGDAIRDIDWNVTARFNKPFVKVFEEERELTLMLLIDVSASVGLGSQKRLKREMIAEIAAVLSFSAMQNNDKIGVILFSDSIEKYIPPKKGRKHVLRIIRELLEFSPSNVGTDIQNALQYFTNATKRKCTAFVISDFADRKPFGDAFTIANKKHDIIAIRIYDLLEHDFPSVGLLRMHNVETGHEQWLDTSHFATREYLQQQRMLHFEKLETVFSKAGIDRVHIQAHEDYVKPLIQLFKQR